MKQKVSWAATESLHGIISYDENTVDQKYYFSTEFHTMFISWHQWMTGGLTVIA